MARNHTAASVNHAQGHLSAKAKRRRRLLPLELWPLAGMSSPLSFLPIRVLLPPTQGLKQQSNGALNTVLWNRLEANSTMRPPRQFSSHLRLPDNAHFLPQLV